MGNAAASSQGLFAGWETPVPLVLSTLMLHSAGQGHHCTLCSAPKPRGSCWKPQLIWQWSSATARCEEMPYHKQGHLSSETQKQSPDYVWLLKVPAGLLIPVCWPKSILGDSTLAISISRIVPVGSALGLCLLFQTGLLCFGTADIFQRQPHCSGVWSALFISLTCLIAMEWGLINYAQFVIAVKSKGIFPLASCGPGLPLRAHFDLEIPSCKNK